MLTKVNTNPFLHPFPLEGRGCAILSFWQTFRMHLIWRRSMNRTNQSGFTFIEVMIAMVMGSVAILLISSTLLTSQKSLIRSRQRFIFFEEADAAAAVQISQISDPFYQGQGTEEYNGSQFNWQVTSNRGLIRLNIEGNEKSKKLSCEFEIYRSAWLQRMGESHE